MWDEEVDVVCVGGTVGALASALAAVDAGAEVLVATAPGSAAPQDHPVPTPAQLHRGWLTPSPDDEELRDYFEALGEDLAGLDGVAVEVDVPTRTVRDQTAEELDSRWVEPFYGGRLRKWATACLRSSYGLLHSRVADWPTTTMRTLTGRGIEVKLLGEVPAADDAPATLVDWLADRAQERHLAVRDDAVLQRLVFEDGDVVGAVLDTVDGPFAIRARHGVTIAPADAHATAAGDRLLRRVDGFTQLGLVSESASRFARLELLDTTGAVPPRAVTCHSANRQLHHNLRDGRQWRSDSARSRELHGYPSGGK